MHIQVPGIEGFKLPSAMREEAGYDVLPFVNNGVMGCSIGVVEVCI